MWTHQREILLYYDPGNSSHRATRAHARSVVPHLKEYDFAHSPSNGTSWHQIITSLGKHPKELMNKAHPYYQSHLRGREFDEESWLKILCKNPALFKAPIAVRGHHALLCDTPTAVYRLAR
ncbi:MAG: ArsC/Spx/MgsR family protein [Bacteroidota bacterium]